MVEIKVEERKRGAPWMIIVLLLIVAVVIGWWLWYNRSKGEPTTGTPSSSVADSVARTP